MNFSVDDFFKLIERTETDKKAWALMRLDDTGNEFEVATFSGLETAEVARKSYQLRNPKQQYFLKRK